ncbi:DUF1254 domain-containing protein [Polymorphobacter sp. PAMC 29334]|uniref:DUF1254 domain-containing protein n=1 Tax=Polymorphobacter sp. PAMC 29334 TaxID=2862331 RepID=UPI001C78D654|nr:DUF1254 domain-containing protein [Polymorphobacter sp. PAMC 29334]QYE34095.1 DUF1254 domain-containing protein [Polymorphobacter sp. PAMC 29334]
MTAKAITLLLACALTAPALAQTEHTPLFGKHKAKTVAQPVAPVAALPAPPVVAAPAAPVVAAEIPAVPPAEATAAPAGPIGIAQLRAAYAFALPVYEMMRTRHLQIAKAESMGAPGVNRLYARTVLADATTRDVTTPNNDTLYSSGWLDLAGGPVILDMPALPKRYHSAALMDVFTNNVAIVGTRTGGKGGRYLIVGPDWNGTPPDGMTVLRSPTNDAWLLVRVLVDGKADLAAATGLIRGFTLEVPADHAAPVATKAVPVAVPDAATFIAVVDEALARSPLAHTVRTRPELSALGVTPDAIDSTAVRPATMALWTKSLPTLHAEFKGGLTKTGTEIDGWSYPGPGIGHYGESDDADRARVAVGGLGALPQTEAIYLTATKDKDGAPLTGAKAYTVHLPAQLPVGAFWSLTMYQADAAGRLFFVDTPSKRFAIGDRTPEIRAERDGGYDIFVQPLAPSGERVVNWLPSPKGPFRLIFRAYLPKAGFLDGSFKLPPVEATEVIP